MAKLPSSRVPEQNSVGVPPKLAEAPSSTPRRPLDASEVGLPIAGDLFELKLASGTEIDGLIIPAGTVVRGRVHHANVARWVQLNPQEGFWAFEIFSSSGPADKTYWVRDGGNGFWSVIELA